MDHFNGFGVSCLQYVLEPSFRQAFQNVNRWFMTMINQPQVKAVIGDFKLCEKMAQFDGKKYAEIQGKMKQGGDKVSSPLLSLFPPW